MILIGFIGLLLAAIGFIIGGLLAMGLSGAQHRIAAIYSLCTGIILGLIYFDILPDSIGLGSWRVWLVGFGIGIGMYYLLHRVLLKVIPDPSKEIVYFRTSLLLAISISIHNFPMGVAFGSSEALGVSNSLLHLLILHNIPEGIALFTPIFFIGPKLKTLIWLSFVVSLPVGIGASIGQSLDIGMSHPIVWSLIMSIAIGMMIVVTINEVFMEALKRISIVKGFFFVAIGITFVWFYLKFI